MASYNELNALIDAYINRNGVQAITGQILNGVLKAMVEQLGRGYTIMGAAIPTTDPGTPDGPECYFASETGTYTDFDGLQVAPGELALLCYTPSDGWTKATIYEGFRQVGATIDGNVGTPSVGVSYANGVLSFDFHNMKGNPGQNGQDGAAAGFGTIGADITGGVGTPGVSVESSGPATAKNLQFHFTNLKGETGVTSVVATVDNTSGTPACTVSLVGQQLTLAFSGLKGAQGDTGSSVDYPFTIVNNLTTDDATQALSAAQGKVLDGKVTQLEAEVGILNDALDIDVETSRMTRQLVAGTDYTTQSGYVVASGAYFSTGADKNMSSVIELKNGETITVKASVPTQCCAIAKVASEAATSATPLVLGDMANTVKTYSYTATEDCLIRCSWQVNNSMPAAIITAHAETTIITTNISEIQDDINRIDGEVEVSDLPIRVQVFRNMIVNIGQDDGTLSASPGWYTACLDIKDGIKTIKFGSSVAAITGYGFWLADGTFSGTLGTNGTKTVNVPDNAKRFYASYKVADYPTNTILISGSRLLLEDIEQVAVQRITDAYKHGLYSVVESNKVGRFKYDEVGVSDYYAAFDELSYTFPDFVKMAKIGDSQQPSAGQTDQTIYPINRYRYKKATASPSKMIALMGACHGDSQGWTNNGGDSAQNIVCPYFFLLDLLMNPEKNEQYKWLTDNYIIDVIPIINPWGVQNHSRLNGRSVDLNRNFDYRWANSTSGEKGESAFSEAEAQAYRDYIEALLTETSTPLEMVFDVHSRGGVLIAGDGRFFTVGPSDLKTPYSVAHLMAGRYGGAYGQTTYTSSNAEPMGWAWIKWVKGVDAFNPELCQSLAQDITTRNSKMTNLQMTDYLSQLVFWCLNPSGVTD